MADPLSATGTAFGIISLTIQACQSLVQFYGSWGDAKSNVVKMTTSTTALVSMLKLLRTVLEEDLLEDNIRTEALMLMKLELSGLSKAHYSYKWGCTANYANYANHLTSLPNSRDVLLGGLSLNFNKRSKEALRTFQSLSRS
jgi:hypothetical protein